MHCLLGHSKNYWLIDWLIDSGFETKRHTWNLQCALEAHDYIYIFLIYRPTSYFCAFLAFSFARFNCALLIVRYSAVICRNALKRVVAFHIHFSQRRTRCALPGSGASCCTCNWRRDGLKRANGRPYRADYDAAAGTGTARRPTWDEAMPGSACKSTAAMSGSR